ncbi:MAG: hypothetical protein FWC01_01405 [Treponema sp.]|nr:hypothetical protein [Treponema sp.]MCL2238151.1 hypothetical protein [Treponema sp.]
MTETISNEDYTISDEAFLKFWAEEIEKQDTISKQVIESERILKEQTELNFRQIEESEKNFLLFFKDLVTWIRGKPE